MGTVLENKRARWCYQVLETWETGLALTGQEVKSLKGGHGDLRNAYVSVRAVARRGASRPRLVAELINAHLPPYARAGPLPGYDPRRARRLLFHRRELMNLLGRLTTPGLTLVPLKVYTRNRRLKVLVGLARGKSTADKREAIRRREVDREVRRSVLSVDRRRAASL
jgi:SsrA-binding protein